MDLAELGLPLPEQKPSQGDFGQLNGVDLHAQYDSERTGGDFFDTVLVAARLAFLLSDIAGRRPALDPIVAEMQRVFRATSQDLFTAANVNLMEAAETLILAINHALIGKIQEQCFQLLQFRLIESSWRQYPWGVMRDGVLESTEKRLKYFGILLQDSAADHFASCNAT